MSSEWHFALQAPWGLPGASAAIAVALAVVVLGVASARRERRRGRRLLLAVLRLGAAGAALVLFLQPAIQIENVTRLPNKIAVLVDGSESMALAERAGEPSRAARAAKLLATSKGEFARWREQHRIDFYTYGATLSPATEEALVGPPGAPPVQDATRLREALAALRTRYQGRDLAGVVVISDGIDTGRLGETFTDGKLDADGTDFLQSLGAPVHTVWTGHGGLRDVAIAHVLADDFAFARTAVTIEAIVRTVGAAEAGWEGKTLPVTLRKDGVVVKTAAVVVDAAHPDQKVTFEFTPDRVGKYLYEVATPLLDGEAIATNNARTFLLKVIRDKIRVLQVAGRPSWDERFLRGLLKHDPNVDLISFFILRTPTDIETVSPDEMSLIPFPTEELFLEQLRSFDVVFLQNFNYAPYGIGIYLDEIKRYVEAGGGLAMLGGDLSFTSGGYARSPVSDVLPVELLDEGPPGSLVSQDAFKPVLTPEGRGHPITALRLEAKENLLRWEALPPLEGTNLVARARPGATVLATHPFQKGRDGRAMPVLTVGDAGKGRVLALTSDSSWRWGFGAAMPAPGSRSSESSGAAMEAGAQGAEAGDGMRGRWYQRFWENAIRWLIRDPELRFLRVETDQPEYGRGEKVRITVRALTSEYRPAAALDVAVSVARVPGAAAPSSGGPIAAKTLLTDENGESVLELDPLPPGGYRVTARALLGKGAAAAAAHHDEEVFLVRGGGRELEEAEARDDLLRAVAEATSGQHRGPAEAWGGLTFLEPEVVRVNKHRDVELWSTWITLLFAALFLSSDWTLRRRWGLA
ncbi:MAG: hypothetical protein EXR72_17125 [Myxococcales bacterium]|nr:hypothetical protein [Myxococcales bacterium]